jgi:YHS domain-containing protein
VAKDPVCGMDVKAQDVKGTAPYGDKTFNFCSTECQQKFEQNPERYGRQSA